MRARTKFDIVLTPVILIVMGIVYVLFDNGVSSDDMITYGLLTAGILVVLAIISTIPSRIKKKSNPVQNKEPHSKAPLIRDNKTVYKSKIKKLAIRIKNKEYKVKTLIDRLWAFICIAFFAVSVFWSVISLITKIAHGKFDEIEGFDIFGSIIAGFAIFIFATVYFDMFTTHIKRKNLTQLNKFGHVHKKGLYLSNENVIVKLLKNEIYATDTEEIRSITVEDSIRKGDMWEMLCRMFNENTVFDDCKKVFEKTGAKILQDD